MLFIIPGIVKAISYSQAMMIVADNPRISARDAINSSISIMEGHKKEYFILMISFIGWLLLGIVTLGIAMIWVIPYIVATEVNFYNEISSGNYIFT